MASPRISYGDGVRDVWGDPLFRAFFVVQFLQGVTFGCVMPYLPLWAVDVLHADATRVGVLRTLSGAISVAAGIALGMLSDRLRLRRRFILFALATTVGAFLALSRVQSLWLAVPLMGLTQLGQSSMLFALLGEWLRARKVSAPATINTTVRLASTLGFALGPVVASQIVRRSGFSMLFLSIAGVQILSVVLTAFGFHDTPPQPKTGPKAQAKAGASVAVLVLFLLAALLGFAAHPARALMMPLYLTRVLKEPVTSVGNFFTLAMLIQAPIFIYAGRAADRFGAVPVLLAGLVCEVGYYVLAGHATSFGALLLIEPLYAISMSTLHGVGMMHIQDLWPARVGTALGVYQSLVMMGPVLVAPYIGHIFDHQGWGAATRFAALLAFAGLVFLLLGRQRRPQATAAS